MEDRSGLNAADIGYRSLSDVEEIGVGYLGDRGWWWRSAVDVAPIGRKSASNFANI